MNDGKRSVDCVIKSRQQRIEETKQWFLSNCVEDPINGTVFDCAMLDAFHDLELKFPNVE